jgi:hypothetical protein
MDEKLSRLIASINDNTAVKPIPSDAIFFRLVHQDKLDKKKHIPSPSCFAYIPEDVDDGLSVDWEALTTPEMSLAIVGMTFRVNKQEFKDPYSFHVYKLENAFLSELDGINKVRHAPNFYGNPPPVGKPNNPSHTIVVYTDPNDPEIRVKLQNHATAVEPKKELIADLLNSLSAISGTTASDANGI